MTRRSSDGWPKNTGGYRRQIARRVWGTTTAASPTVELARSTMTARGAHARLPPPRSRGRPHSRRAMPRIARPASPSESRIEISLIWVRVADHSPDPACLLPSRESHFRSPRESAGSCAEPEMTPTGLYRRSSIGGYDTISPPNPVLNRYRPRQSSPLVPAIESPLSLTFSGSLPGMPQRS